MATKDNNEECLDVNRDPENKFIFDLPKSLERKDNMSDMFNMMNVFALVIFIKLVFIGMVVA